MSGADREVAMTATVEPIDIRFDETTPRAELIEALCHLSVEAGRMQQVVGTAALPTRWDRAHAVMDRMLVLLEAR
jgi:hypothetical protein